MNSDAGSFSFTGRLRSVRHAINGIADMLKEQHNAWIHALATLVVVIAGLLTQISSTEWLALILAISLVWVAETLNTAFECLCDVASPEFHPLVKKSKDIAAGAVFLAAIGAFTVGLVVFVPYVRASIQ